MTASVDDVARADLLELLAISQPSQLVLRISLRLLPPLSAPGTAEEVAAAPCLSLCWQQCVAHSVRAGSFAVAENTELLQGYKLVQFSKSRYLDYIREATLAADRFADRLRHYGVFCRDQVIDVVAAEEPSVEIPEVWPTAEDGV